MGWAISKTYTACTRFSQKVKEYLTGKFVIGEKTGRNAYPAQVEKDMRTARNPSNERQFSCTEWLTKTHRDAKNRAYLVCQWKQKKM